MVKLYETELDVFFYYLAVLKNNYDDGGKSAVDLYSDCNYDYESFDEDTYGKMGDAAEHVSCKTMYYPNVNGEINRYCEPSYDIWFMSSRDMTEYYRTLNKLYREKKISLKEYKNHKDEMYKKARSCILHTDVAQCAGATFSLRTKTRHKYDSSINIYIDCDYCCSLFEISCGAATLFDTYSKKLMELREKYYDEDDEYWRRYDWIKMKG